jgi:hypothetical protein
MDVEYCLTGAGAVIKDGPEGITNTLLAGDISGNTHHLADHLFVLFAYLARTTYMFLGDNQKVGRGLGTDVPEGIHVIILIELVGGDITINDFAKETVVHEKPQMGRMKDGAVLRENSAISDCQSEQKCTEAGGECQFL